MKKVILILAILISLPCFAVDIDYGFNANGDYVPTSIGGQSIDYGYNAVGDYVPLSIGDRHINYGYNAYGDYVPMEIDF